MSYSCITPISNWVYIEKVVVIPDISNPNTSISKIIDLKGPLTNEWKSHFHLSKMPKMNIVKHKETRR